MEGLEGFDESLIFKYFPNLSEIQKKQFIDLKSLYEEWNAQINVVSRKDLDELYCRHVLHSLSIAKLIEFPDNCKVLDIGTGGGFPGIPLAILFPNVKFHLVDSIGKKIKVVNEVAKALGLKNVLAEQMRAEKTQTKYHFIVTRAVTGLPKLKYWVKRKFENSSILNTRRNGLICLKGGDLDAEIKESGLKTQSFNISKYFSEDFFDTKKIIYVNAKELK